MDTYANEAMLAEAAASERDRARKAEAINAELLDALKTIQVVNASNGPLRYEIIDATCDSAIRKAQP